MWNETEHLSLGLLIILRKCSSLAWQCRVNCSLHPADCFLSSAPFLPTPVLRILYPPFCSFCTVERWGTQCCNEPNFIVEAGRFELPSEIKPRRTSTCLVHWIVLIPVSASYPKYRNQLMRSHSVDMSTLLNQPVKMTPLSKTTGKFYSGRLTSVKRKQLGRNWHLLCFPGD